MAFLNTRFPSDISYNATGGPSYSTDVVIVNSGFEQRNANWAASRCNFDVSHAIKSKTQLDTLIAFFRVAQGRANAFRYKDWFDYQVSTGYLDTGAVGDGTPTYQLYKYYSNAAGSELRKITRPVSGQVAVLRNAGAVTIGAAAGNIAIDYETGIVTFVADSIKTIDANVVKNITAITQAANAQVTTSTSHGFVTGDKIKLAAVGGMTQVNDLYFTISVVDATNFQLNVNSSAYTAYTSGGTSTKFGATQTSPVRIYSAAHGFTSGKEIYISGVSGMTELNGIAFTITNVATDYFELSGINGTAYTAKTTGGTLGLYPQAEDALTWSGEFDIPARFDVDQLKAEYIGPDVLGWQEIPIVEVRE